MNEKGERLKYIKDGIKELLDECEDVELLYLVRGLLIKGKERGR